MAFRYPGLTHGIPFIIGEISSTIGLSTMQMGATVLAQDRDIIPSAVSGPRGDQTPRVLIDAAVSWRPNVTVGPLFQFTFSLLNFPFDIMEFPLTGCSNITGMITISSALNITIPNRLS